MTEIIIISLVGDSTKFSGFPVATIILKGTGVHIQSVLQNVAYLEKQQHMKDIATASYRALRRSKNYLRLVGLLQTRT